ncbi:GNAT family N-acetyltransferase [Chitinimonas sp.]|uniref:GNAT family N-acetyltransferase n=1 Tax=Chitinimonas sp. TaxID=1934313 RepID=UPI002F93BD47
MTAYTLTLNNGRTARAELHDDRALLWLGNEILTELALEPGGGEQIRLSGALPLEPQPQALLPLLAELFCRRPQLLRVVLVLACSRDFATAAVRHGVATEVSADGQAWLLRCERATFWQQPALWLTTPSSAGMALDYVVSGGKRHPRRAPTPQGVVYRRYLPALDSTITLRVAELDRDLNAFHDWMNQERVHRFWELAGDKASHATYLQAQLDDPKVVPLIGEFDGEAFAYFETYWAKEDRIAPFYDVADFDRGCHVLVGNSRHRGPAKVTVWMRALSHYLFLDDPRTQRIVGEPRVDNSRFIAYLQSQGFGKLKEFDFPHKRSAMVVLEREAFAGQYGPWGEE